MMTAWFLSLAIKATLLLLVVVAAAAGARRSAAATRHFVWLSGLAALLLMPVLGVLAPAWSPAWAGDWLPAYLLTDPPRAVAPAASQTPFVAVGSWVMARPDVAAHPYAGASDTAGSTIAAAERRAALDQASVSGVFSAAMPFWLALVWAGGVVAMVSWLAVGFVRRTRLARRAVAVDGGVLADASDIAATALGVQRRVRLLLGDSRVVPMTWGIVRPVLLLPAAAGDWSTRRLHTVLMHELAHIKRHDSLSRSLGQLACSVFWFHPLAWISAGRMLREQERACDDLVLLSGANPHRYAETLVAIAREFRSPRPSVVGALAFARRSNLEHRLLSILDPLKRRKKLNLSRKVMVLALFVGGVLPLAALQPAASAQEPDAVQQADPQSKPRPKVAVVVERQDVSVVSVGVVVPRADAAITQGGVARRQRPLVRRVDTSSRIQLEAEGVGLVTDTVADVELADDGWLVLTELQRRLEIRPSGGGGLDFTYSVDGAEADFDDEARQWADEILVHVAEMGTLRGNLFIRMSRADISGELAPLVLEPLAFETLRLAIEPLELAAESLALTIEPLEFVAESLAVSIEPLMLAGESLAISIEPLMLAGESLAVSIEPLELLVESLKTIEVVLDTPLAGDGRTGRFDRVNTWSEDGSRFVAMQRGLVSLGETIDEIEVGASGDLVIDERSADGVHRRLHVFAGEAGETTFEWFIDGEASTFDSAGRAWLQPILDWLNENGG